MNAHFLKSILVFSVEASGLFLLSGKISNTVKEIVHLVRIEVHIDTEEGGSKILENVIHLPFFRSMVVRRCTVNVVCLEDLTFLCSIA